MVRRATAALALFTLAVCIGSVFRSPARAGGPQSFRLLVETEPLRPMGVAVDETGRKAYVALFGVDHLVEVDLATQSLNWRVPVAQPTNVAIDGDEIYVLTFGNKVEAIHRRTQNSRKVERADVPANIGDILFNPLPPWIIEPDPNRLVGRQLLTPVHSPTLHETAVELLRDGPFDNRLTLSTLRDSGNLPAMHSMPHAPPRIASPNNSQGALGFGGGFQSALGFAGGNNQTGLGWGGGFESPSAPLDFSFGAALPVATVTHLDSNTLFVSAMGSDCVLALDHARLKSFLERKTKSPDARPDYLKARLATKSGPGPMALSGDGRVLVVANTLADSLTVISTGKSPRVVGFVSLGGPPLDSVRRGERLFHSAKLSKTGRFACASCHPLGGSDFETWAMPASNDKRMPKPIFAIRETGPYGWKGEDATLEIHVERTMQTLFQRSPSRQELSDLIAYLDSLPFPSRSAPEKDNHLIEPGRHLFQNEANCVRCHKEPLFQDGQNHDVGTGGEYNTPSLIGVGGRQRLLHDGRARTFEQIFSDHDPKHVHGKLRDLSIEEKAALFAFVRRL